MTGHETPFTSDTLVAESSESDDEFFFPGPQVSNTQQHTNASTPDRYFKQKRSAHGKVSYVVFAGHDVGVFYNWYVFIVCRKNYRLSSLTRTTAALATSGLEYSSKVFKGYSSYDAAHSAWNGFMETGNLPTDVAASLGTRTYPTPPTPTVPTYVSPPTGASQHVRAYDHRCVSESPLISQQPTSMPFTPHRVPTSFGPSSSRTPIKAGNRLNTVQSMSPSASRTPPSTQQRDLTTAREEAFRADQEDFWVVFTGTAPGVHQGR